MSTPRFLFALLVAGIFGCNSSGSLDGNPGSADTGSSDGNPGSADTGATTDGGLAPSDATTGSDATINDDATATGDATIGVDAGGADATLPSEAGSPEDSGGSNDGSGDAATPWSAVIGPAGGTLTYPGGATLQIPAGAIMTPTQITLLPIAAPTNVTVVGGAFAIEPAGLTFQTPAVLTLPYLASQLPPDAASSSLAIEASSDTGATFVALSSTADTTMDTVTAALLETGEVAPILVSGGALFVTTTSPLTAGFVATAYSATLAAAGGTPPYSWSPSASTSLPLGLALASTGVLAGTPTTAGHYSFLVRVADSDAHVTQAALAMDVDAPNAVPTLTGLASPSAQAGTAAELEVFGTGFLSTSSIDFAGTGLPTTYVSDTELLAPLNAQVAGTYAVTVVNPAPGGGTSNALVFTVDNPLPGINSLTPSSALAGSPDTQVTIAGAEFVSSTQVLVNGTVVSSSYVSSYEMLALVPAADLVNAGTLTVAVQNAAPGGGTASAQFTVAPLDAGSAPVACTKSVTSSLNEVNPFGTAITITYQMVGAAGGSAGFEPGLEDQPGTAGGGGGGSSAILNAGTVVSVANGGNGGNGVTNAPGPAPGSPGATTSGSFVLASGANLTVFVGGGGGCAALNAGGGGGSGYFGGGAGGNVVTVAFPAFPDAGLGGTGGSTVGGAGGLGGDGPGGSGVSQAGGNAVNGAYGGNGGTGGAAGLPDLGGGGGGGFGGGGGSPVSNGDSVLGPGGSDGGNGGGEAPFYLGFGASSWSSIGDSRAGQGAGEVGGNAGGVFLKYTSPTGQCSL